MKTTWQVSIAAALFGVACHPAPDTRATAAADPVPAMVMAADTATGVDQILARDSVYLTIAQARSIGVLYTAVTAGPLLRTVRTVGQVTAAEPDLADITSKIDGYVDTLYADQTGAMVHRGDPLLTLYSPTLVAAEQELLTADRLLADQDSSDVDTWPNARELVAAARRRLAWFDISADQIARIEHTGEITRTLTLHAPFDGVVLDKSVVRGQTVTAGMKLYRLADLSTVWVEGEVFEQDLATVRVGTPALVQVDAYPGRTFRGMVSFVSPTVDEQSRTGQVRVALTNRDGALRPGMFATILASADMGGALLSLPAEAVVQTGQRNLVFVAGPNGMLTARAVTIGQQAGDRLEILRGVVAGERVVASANFLVDAESRLGSGDATAAMPGMDMSAAAPAAGAR